MKTFEHDFSLNVSVRSPCEDPDDIDPEAIIIALERRITALKQNKKAWADYVEHFCTEDITQYVRGAT